MNLPTQQDINPIPEDLDGRTAVRNFLGKPREQIAREFAEHGMSYQEDLMFMGPRAFSFYFPAAVDYITSSQGSTDGDVASCLISVVEHRLEYDAPEIRGAAPHIAQFADYVLAHYNGFGFDPDIYGDLRQRLNHIQKILRRTLKGVLSGVKRSQEIHPHNKPDAGDPVMSLRLAIQERWRPP